MYIVTVLKSELQNGLTIFSQTAEYTTCAKDTIMNLQVDVLYMTSLLSLAKVKNTFSLRKAVQQHLIIPAGVAP